MGNDTRNGCRAAAVIVFNQLIEARKLFQNWTRLLKISAGKLSNFFMKIVQYFTMKESVLMNLFFKTGSFKLCKMWVCDVFLIKLYFKATEDGDNSLSSFCFF